MSATLLGACSLTLDTDQNQCSKASDCDGKIGGSSTQICVKGFCQAVVCDTNLPVFEQDKQCRASKDRSELATSHCSAGTCAESECTKGGDECGNERVCDTLRNVCVEPDKASCGGAGSANPLDPSLDCANYEGLATFICQDNVCVEPACKKDADCTTVSDTAVCDKGECTDKSWGCVGEPDNRMSEAPATFKLTALAFGTNDPIPGLKVTACFSAVGDRDCTTPIADATYDEGTGIVTVTGLEPRQQFRLRLVPPKETGLYTVDFYSMLTPVGDTMEVGEALLVPTALVGQLDSAFASQGVEVEKDDMGVPTLGNMVTRVFDCELKQASKIRITYESQSASTLTYYLDSSLVTPHTDWSESDETGVGGVINLKVNGPSKIDIKRGDNTVASFSTVFQPGVLTYVNFYPRAYGIAP